VFHQEILRQVGFVVFGDGSKLVNNEIDKRSKREKNSKNKENSRRNAIRTGTIWVVVLSYLL
jgi:hypothetical protein